jgi:hypothetical protein
MIFLIWQVAAKVAAEPSCVQVRSHDTIFHPIFPCDLMMWTQKSNKKSFQNRLAFYFHRQSDENSIIKTVKEIRSDFNWSINSVKILMFNCFLIKSVFCHFVYFLLYPLFRFGFCNISKEYKKKHNIWYVSCNKYSVELMRDADIYIS